MTGSDGLRWRDDAPADLRRGTEPLLAARASAGRDGTGTGGMAVVQDPDGTIVAADPAALAAMGADWDLASGHRRVQRLGNVLGTDGMPLPTDRLPTVVAMTTGRPVRDALLGLVPPRGSGRRRTLWLAVDAVPVVTADGRVLGTVSWVHDASDTERARDAAAEIEASFRALAEDAVDLVTRHTADGRVRYASPSSVAVLGWPPEELLGQDFRDLCHPEDYDLAFGAARPDEPEDMRVARYRLRRADGTWADVETSSRQVRDLDGSVAEIHCVTRDIGPRLALERRAAAAEAEFRTLAENSSDLVLRTTADGVCAWVSPSVTGVLGYRPADVVGVPLEDLVHPDDLPRAKAARVDAATTGGLVTLELRFRTATGETRWLAARGQPLFDSGTFVGGVVALRDIHEEVLARQALFESQQRFRAAIRAAAGGIAFVAPDGRFVEVNDALCAYLGRDEATLLASNVADVTHPDDREADEAGVAALFAGDVPMLRRRKRFVRADGAVVWGDVSSAVVRDRDGAPVHRVAQVVDVTAEVRAREELAASEARFRLIAENAQEVVVTFDGAGVITWATPSVAAMLGWQPGKLVGLPGVDFLHPDSVPAEADVMAGLGEPAEHEVRLRRRDGTYRWVVVRTVVHRDPATGETMGVAAARDAQAEVEARDALAYRASHDALTGLTNRQSLVERMAVLLDPAAATASDVAVLFCDLDNLKAVNDRLGHDAGDRLLREVATRIRAEVRPQDIAARFGGDEFVVVLEGVHAASVAVERAERIRAGVAEPVDLDGVAVVTTMSVGVARAMPGDDPESVIREADAALYRAKHGGRDRVCLADG